MAWKNFIYTTVCWGTADLKKCLMKWQEQLSYKEINTHHLPLVTSSSLHILLMLPITSPILSVSRFLLCVLPDVLPRVSFFVHLPNCFWIRSLFCCSTCFTYYSLFISLFCYSICFIYYSLFIFFYSRHMLVIMSFYGLNEQIY